MGFASGRGDGSAGGGYLFLRQVAHIGLAFFDKLYGVFIQGLEIIRSIVFSIPVEAQPFHVFLDGIDIFGVFLGGVGVVETQVAFAAVFFGQPEVQANGFGMAYMKITVGVRAENGCVPW